ncbi:hypothetical protein COS75_02335 [Candidatus Pacearchaeota archaeon CG06_land_8_20_14_3_00_35_12]|nr:MAG: hypothetical protein COS75_02335 [Candidatus Pacearchaeota archaeon CG06_land_8_20_14_3_00_35_12]
MFSSIKGALSEMYGNNVDEVSFGVNREVRSWIYYKSGGARKPVDFLEARRCSAGCTLEVNLEIRNAFFDQKDSQCIVLGSAGS